jgi:hypothetical protein
MESSRMEAAWLGKSVWRYAIRCAITGHIIVQDVSMIAAIQTWLPSSTGPNARPSWSTSFAGVIAPLGSGAIAALPVRSL